MQPKRFASRGTKKKVCTVISVLKYGGGGGEGDKCGIKGTYYQASLCGVGTGDKAVNF